MQTRPLQSTIGSACVEVLSATACAAIAWGAGTFSNRICVLSSMQETTVIDLAMRVDPTIPVVFLDTGYHFDETLETVRQVERRYDIEVVVVPPLGPPRTKIVAGECCDGKADQLNIALRHRDAWISGIRRQQTETRKTAPIIGVDGRDENKAKISPLAQWDDRDIDAYSRANDLIRNPLLDQGYASIGCRTCTLPANARHTNTEQVDTGQSKPSPSEQADSRAGRWTGTKRTECGLHN